MGSESKVGTGSWLFVIAIVLIFGFFGPVWTTMVPGVFTNWYVPGTVGCKLWVPVLPTALILFLGFLRELGLFKSTDARTFAFLYIATIGLVVFLSYDGWPIQDTYTGFLASRIVELNEPFEIKTELPSELKLDPGDEVTYKISVTNNGQHTYTATFTYTVTADPGVEYKISPASGEQKTLGPGEKWDILVTISIPESSASGTLTITWQIERT